MDERRKQRVMEILETIPPILPGLGLRDQEARNVDNLVRRLRSSAEHPVVPQTRLLAASLHGELTSKGRNDARELILLFS